MVSEFNDINYLQTKMKWLSGWWHKKFRSGPYASFYQCEGFLRVAHEVFKLRLTQIINFSVLICFIIHKINGIINSTKLLLRLVLAQHRWCFEFLISIIMLMAYAIITLVWKKNDFSCLDPIFILTYLTARIFPRTTYLVGTSMYILFICRQSILLL